MANDINAKTIQAVCTEFNMRNVLEGTAQEHQDGKSAINVMLHRLFNTLLGGGDGDRVGVGGGSQSPGGEITRPTLSRRRFKTLHTNQYLFLLRKTVRSLVYQHTRRQGPHDKYW